MKYFTNINSFFLYNYPVQWIFLLSPLCREGFPGGLVVQDLPARQETWVQSLGWEDALEKEMVTHCSILAWEIPWTEESGDLQYMGVSKKSDMT